MSRKVKIVIGMVVVFVVLMALRCGISKRKVRQG